eukprot:g79033.t1
MFLNFAQSFESDKPRCLKRPFKFSRNTKKSVGYSWAYKGLLRRQTLSKGKRIRSIEIEFSIEDEGLGIAKRRREKGDLTNHDMRDLVLQRGEGRKEI